MTDVKPEMLILYSNPSDTFRLRLDKEHRVIEQIIRNVGIDPRRILRLHAASVTDFIGELPKGDFEIVQFSGHGSSKEGYLE